MALGAVTVVVVAEFPGAGGWLPGVVDVVTAVVAGTSIVNKSTSSAGPAVLTNATRPVALLSMRRYLY